VEFRYEILALSPLEKHNKTEIDNFIVAHEPSGLLPWDVAIRRECVLVITPPSPVEKKKDHSIADHEPSRLLPWEEPTKKELDSRKEA